MSEKRRTPAISIIDQIKNEFGPSRMVRRPTAPRARQPRTRWKPRKWVEAPSRSRTTRLVTTIWLRDGRFSQDQRIGINIAVTPPIVAKRIAAGRSMLGANFWSANFADPFLESRDELFRLHKSSAKVAATHPQMTSPARYTAK